MTPRVRCLLETEEAAKERRAVFEQACVETGCRPLSGPDYMYVEGTPEQIRQLGQKLGWDMSHGHWAPPMSEGKEGIG